MCPDCPTFRARGGLCLNEIYEMFVCRRISGDPCTRCSLVQPPSHVAEPPTHAQRVRRSTLPQTDIRAEPNRMRLRFNVQYSVVRLQFLAGP